MSSLASSRRPSAFLVALLVALLAPVAAAETIEGEGYTLRLPAGYTSQFDSNDAPT